MVCVVLLLLQVHQEPALGYSNGGVSYRHTGTPPRFQWDFSKQNIYVV
jgi:hypothetical protein